MLCTACSSINFPAACGEPSVLQLAQLCSIATHLLYALRTLGKPHCVCGCGMESAAGEVTFDCSYGQEAQTWLSTVYAAMEKMPAGKLFALLKPSTTVLADQPSSLGPFTASDSLPTVHRSISSTKPSSSLRRYKLTVQIPQCTVPSASRRKLTSFKTTSCHPAGERLQSAMQAFQGQDQSQVCSAGHSTGSKAVDAQRFYSAQCAVYIYYRLCSA